MLRVNKLTKYYGQHLGLKELSFSLSAGDVLGILGPNGSGKTTLFRLLLGLIPPTSGRIELQTSKPNSRFFGYLPEERALYRDITVREQIIYLGKLKKLEKSEIERETNYWISRLGLQELQHKLIKQLSKGNQQKVQLICALLHRPSVLILDEPLTGLDAYNVSLFKEIMMEQSQRGKIILLSSHQYEEIETFCHQIILLKKGVCKLKGKILDLKQEDGRVNVIIDQDQEQQYRHLAGVLNIKTEGNYTIYTFRDRYDALCLIQQNRSLTQRLELIGLRDLVEECV